MSLRSFLGEGSKMGWIILASWVLLALIFVAFGKLCESDILLGIGAVMIVMTAMVDDVLY